MIALRCALGSGTILKIKTIVYKVVVIYIWFIVWYRYIYLYILIKEAT